MQGVDEGWGLGGCPRLIITYLHPPPPPLWKLSLTLCRCARGMEAVLEAAVDTASAFRGTRAARVASAPRITCESQDSGVCSYLGPSRRARTGSATGTKRGWTVGAPALLAHPSPRACWKWAPGTR
jgi:hypothetical protein